MIALDLITDLLESQGYDLILTIMDHNVSKMAFFLPCHKTIGAQGVAALYAKQLFPIVGVPSHVISDWDPRFTAQFTKEVCGLLGIDQNISSTFHPQTDGQFE